MAKKRIGLIWEMGGGFGHLYRINTFGSALHAQGHEIHYVIPYHANVLETMQAQAASISTSPMDFTPHALPYESRLNFSETLANFSYVLPEQFSAVCAQWLQLFESIKPDLIITDYSPTAVFIAQCLGIPAIMIGSGFSCPPLAKPMPVYDDGHVSDVIKRIEKVEAQIVESLNLVVASYSQTVFTNVSDIFKTVSHTFLCTFKQLDHYKNRRLSKEQEFIGPVGNQLASIKNQENPVYNKFIEQKESQQKPTALVYLNAKHPSIKNVFVQLTDLEIISICYCPKLDQHIINHYQEKGVYFSATPLDLHACLQEVDIIVHHGGINLSNLGVMYAKPQCLLPRYGEQHITAVNLQEQELGRLVKKDAELKDVLREFVSASETGTKMVQASAEVGQYDEAQTVLQALQKINGLFA